MASRDDRPFYALGALAAVLLVAIVIPVSRLWLLDAVIGPLRAQADPAPGLGHGYSVASLFVWALVGGVLAWLAYELVFVRAAFRPDATFFAALVPALFLGPLLHAALIARALPAGSILAYLAAEPLVYLTIGMFSGVGLFLGHITKQPLVAPLLWGVLGIAPVLYVLTPEFTSGGLGRAGILLALAVVPAIILALAFARVRPGDPLTVLFAVIWAHALDGATTWMVLRDPFGLGFQDFGERNPVSLTLVNMSTGWPFFAVKLALPLLLLSIVKREENEQRMRAFLLFAVFVLGFGPGMANLLQVMMG